MNRPARSPSRAAAFDRIVKIAVTLPAYAAVVVNSGGRA
jgi:hypothetical protein